MTDLKLQILKLKPNSKGVLIIAIILLIVGINSIIYFVWPKEKEIQPVPSATEEPVTALAPLGEFEIENPKMTIPLVKAEIPEEVIQLTISSSGFEPKEFTVKSNQPISLTLTSLDTGTHILKFDNPELEKIQIAVAGTTRGISFIAPEVGDYVFYCSIPGHRETGEAGIMHVE